MMVNNYIVCSTVRSGSTLLCRTLESLGGFGHPEEYFHRHRLAKLNLNDQPDTFLEYCRSIGSQGSAERLGIKMHWWQLVDFLTLARQSLQFEGKGDLEILDMLFPNLVFIYLWRRDLASQAVSAAIASQTGQWEKGDDSGKSTKAKSLKFQPWKIYEWEQSLKEQNHCWRQFFQDNHTNYYETTYEDLISSFPEEIANIVRHIGVDKPLPVQQLEMPTQRQSNTTNQRFIRYYTNLPKPVLGMIYQLYRQLKLVRDGVGT